MRAIYSVPLVAPASQGYLGPSGSIGPARSPLPVAYLLPDFFAVLESADRRSACRRYFPPAHPQCPRRNYALDPDGPHFDEVIRSTIEANWPDLRGTLERTDIVSPAQRAEARTRELLEADVDVDTGQRQGARPCASCSSMKASL